MKEIIALQDYTNQYISLYQGEIRKIETNLANKLIALGVAAQHSTINPSGGGSGSDCSCEIFKVEILAYEPLSEEDDDYLYLNKSYKEIKSAFNDGKNIIFYTHYSDSETDFMEFYTLYNIGHQTNNNYQISIAKGTSVTDFQSDSEEGLLTYGGPDK